MIGPNLSHYHILERLTLCGEIYLARDTKLDRDVVLKMLPEWFFRDAEELAHFRREVEILTSVNHPNIAAIHGIEEPKHGVIFLVVERIEGETLAARLQVGPLASAEALAVCAQIAEALAAAHGRGVINRDLKPRNVMLTSTGLVKVLDFGLARSVAAPVELGDLRAMGTLGYVSPEQLRGEAHDGRADIFAFGCVLFECLTGRRAFTGGTLTDVLEATLTKEPDWSALPSETPVRIRNLLVRCLEKNPQNRLLDIEDARISIHEVKELRSQGA